MISDLTEYVRSLGPAGEPPDSETYEAARELLRSDLVRVMKQRGLWSAPPRYLGVPGGSCWTRDHLDDLVSECYAEVFLLRLPALNNQLLVRDNVDGVIRRSVRNFVHDLQKDNDPLGYKVYDVLRGSLMRLHETGTLQVGDPKAEKLRIRNHTVCAFVPGSPVQVSREIDLAERVRLWNDDLWPDLITAQGRARTRMNDQLDTHVAHLAAEGVAAFRFKDVVEPMKSDVRRRWSDELAALVEEMLSRGEPGGGAGFRQLRDCVLEKLAKASSDEEKDLRKLWVFLWTYAAGVNPSDVAAKAERSGSTPAILGLAQELDIPRHRVPVHLETLGRLVRACESAISRKVAVKEPERGLSRASPIFALLEGLDSMDPTDRRERLRVATGEAAALWAANRGEIEGDPRPPRPGDLFVLATSGDLLVEWAVVEQDAEAALLVPADDSAEVGSRDVAIGHGSGGIATLRCGLAAWLASAALDSGRRTGELAPVVLERMRRKRAAIRDGSLVASLREREADEDPEYRRRLAELAETQAACKMEPEKSGKLLKYPPRDQKPGSWARSPFLRAASILLALGLVATVVYQQLRLGSLEEELRGSAQLNLPFVWLTGDERVRGPEDPLVISSEARRLALVFEVTSPEAFPRYRVEIRRDDETVWASDRLTKSGSEVSFDLPLSWLTSGRYEIDIYGLGAAGTEPELLEEYEIWLRIE